MLFLLHPITTPLKARSRKIRDNFQNTENFLNDLDSQAERLSFAPNPNEVDEARDFHPVLSDRLLSGFRGFSNAVISGGEVKPGDIPGMVLKVLSGEGVVDGIGVRWTEVETQPFVPPLANPRIDLVVVGTDSQILAVEGTEDANPTAPEIYQGQKALGEVRLAPGQALIAPSDIRDLRKVSEKSPKLLSMFSVPVGAILGWHKFFPNTPDLPENFVECSGQVLSDPESPFHGKTIPLLNKNTSDGGRFLRGISLSGVSGEYQDSQNKSHSHVLNDPGHSHSAPTRPGVPLFGPPKFNGAGVGTLDFISTNPAATGVTFQSEGGSENRPKSFTLVWIIRIK